VPQVEFDPSVTSYDGLLEVFWSEHDPTRKDRQGWDVGSQYRSAIFFHSPAQKASALASKERLEMSGRYKNPIVTEILPAGLFYRGGKAPALLREASGGRVRPRGAAGDSVAARTRLDRVAAPA